VFSVLVLAALRYGRTTLLLTDFLIIHGGAAWVQASGFRLQASGFRV